MDVRFVFFGHVTKYPQALIPGKPAPKLITNQVGLNRVKACFR